MHDQNIKKYLFLVPIVLVLCTKFSQLSLPCFWDEAWSYFPAIRQMAANGPSLIPGVISADLEKGHPLFFHFIAAIWMKVIGKSVISVHYFAFTISISTLLISYFSLKKLVNRETALVAVLCLSVQSLFLAQATFLLPEMLVTLLLILSFYFFNRQKYLLYAISSSLMVLTKETTIIFAMLFGLFYLAGISKSLGQRKILLSNLIWLALPAITYGIFLYVHFVQFGYLFFGDHLNYIDTSASSILYKLRISSNIIFLSYGRFVFSALFIAIVFYRLIKSEAIPQKSLILQLLLLLFGFILFSSINFYTLRYMLAPMTLFIFSFAILANELPISEIRKVLMMTVLACLSFYKSLTVTTISDADLGYIQTVELQRSIVHYCEEKNFFDKKLAVSYNMIFALKDNDLGFKKNNQAFTKVSDWKNYEDSDYFIYESTYDGSNEIIDSVRVQFDLIKSFDKGIAKGYIYKNSKH